ncbi:MAG TPA: thioredoxin family protein [Saprospiraceae bacterium]|nr:thioredoxin family protein [Saprospiraceae bacterium]
MTEVMAANKSFTEIISGEETVLVDFYSDWSTPSMAVKPIVEEVRQKMKNKLVVLKIDVDRNLKLARYYNIHSVPTLMIFKNNEIRWRHTGITTVPVIEKILRENL